MSIFDLTVDQIPDAPVVRSTLNHAPIILKDWLHPASEAERLDELIDFLRDDFRVYREVRIAHHEWNGRVDVLAVPKCADFASVVLAFEVKPDRFDVERALKQSADYVGGRVFEGPHCDKRVSACFLYPADTSKYPTRDRYHEGMFQLIAQWRVGRGYVHRGGLWLAIGQEVIWDSRGWHEVRANRMLLGKRIVGGSRREINHEHVELERRF